MSDLSEDALQNKYKLLKRRIREIEENNDAIYLKLAKAQRHIKRLRIERIILLDQLDHFQQSRQHNGSMKKMNLGSDSDLSASEPETYDGGSHPKKNRSKPTATKQSAEGGASAPRKKRDPNAPKGPGNVFFLYCRLERDKFKDEVPSENLGDVTRLLGQKWKALTKEEKKKYYDLYKKEQEEYEEAMKSYTASGGSADPTNADPSHTDILPEDGSAGDGSTEDMHLDDTPTNETSTVNSPNTQSLHLPREDKQPNDSQ